MARLMKPWWSIAVPKDGVISTRAGVRTCAYTSRGEKKTAEVVTIKGKDRLKVVSDVWYCEYFPHGSKKPARVKAFANKRASEAMLATLVREDADRRAGRSVPDGSAVGRTLSDWRDDYLEVLKARGVSPDYVTLCETYLKAILAGCKWRMWPDVIADSLTIWLGRRRDTDGIGPATMNSYIRVAKGFSNWMAGRLKTESPLRGKALPFFAEKPDLRRSRRMLTDAELAALIAAAERCPKRATGMPGVDRGMLYRVAAFTGLRASELAALTSAHFELDSAPPCVRPDPSEDKAKRGDPLPLPDCLVESLRPWLSAKPPTVKLWPGRWADNRNQVSWIARDVKRAQIAEKDAKGRRVTFHSFRRRYITGLIRNGADIDQVKRLGRHKDLKTTLSYYTDEDLPDLGTVVNRLPRLKPL